MDSFRDQQGHLARPSVTNGVNKDFCAVVLSLSPGVWPTKNDSVGFHATQSTGLDPANSWYRTDGQRGTMSLHVTDTVADVVSHHDLWKALDVLVVDDLTKTDPGGLGLSVHLPVLALYDCGSNSEA